MSGATSIHLLIPGPVNIGLERNSATSCILEDDGGKWSSGGCRRRGLEVASWLTRIPQRVGVLSVEEAEKE